MSVERLPNTPFVQRNVILSEAKNLASWKLETRDEKLDYDGRAL